MSSYGLIHFIDINTSLRSPYLTVGKSLSGTRAILNDCKQRIIQIFDIFGDSIVAMATHNESIVRFLI